MLCASVADEGLKKPRIYKNGDDDSGEVRRPKILGIEVQGQSHGSFFTYRHLLYTLLWELI